MKERRLGQFRIDAEIVRSDPESVMEAMGRCVVIRCEMRFDTDCLHYIAWSPEFTPVDLGSEPHEYRVVIHGGGSVEFQRT